MSNPCLDKIKQNAMNIIYDSGKFLQQMGLYQKCADDQLRYSLSLLGNNITKIYNGLYIGLCLPQQCKQKAVEDQINMVLHELQTPFVVVSTIYNPQDLQPEINWVFYPLIAFLLLLVLLTITATILSKSIKKHMKRSLPLRMLEAFDFNQTRKVFAYKPHVFNVFNGIKSICMFWVVFGHEFSVRTKNNVNIADMAPQVQTYFFLFVEAAFFAVDVFFFLGGFLVAYSFLREKSKNILKYPIAIVHRVLRFWPSYLTTILIFYAILMHTGSGPIWWNNQATTELDNCERLWKPMFFVDNLVDNGQQMCLGWGWYLQNDMQIFIFSMIFLYIYNNTKNKFITTLTIMLTILGSIILNIVQVQNNEYIQVTHLADFAKWGQYFPNIYIKPWTRCPPYLLGLFFGIQYMQYSAVEKKRKQEIEKANNQQQMNRTSMNESELEITEPANLPTHSYIKLRENFKKNKTLLYLFQLVGLAIMLFVVLCPRNLQLGNKWPQILHSLYLSLGKVFFVLGMYLSILPSLLGVPNFTFTIMDTKFFNFISKVSFWTYLIHYMVVLQVTYRQKLDFYYTIYDILPLYIPIAAISVFLGLMGTILVELPFAKLQKMLMNVLMGKKQNRNVDKVGSLTEPLNVSMKNSVETSSSLGQSVKL